MTEDEHKQIRVLLHKKLDELVADFIEQTGKSLNESSIMELIEWSYRQAQSPSLKP